MSLKKYKGKRNFTSTPEPEGSKIVNSKSLQFVIQKHDARQLHYDLRLEYNNILLSWAIPKGPTMNPEYKRLAVKVEDHPVSYKDFEGIIPEGNYGAGKVIVWDKGTYEPIGELNLKPNDIIEKGIKKGHLDFNLNGEKLKGHFTLIRTEANKWLFFKKNDQFASQEDILNEDKSVISNKTIEELSYNILPPLNDTENTIKGRFPGFIAPMLTRLINNAFNDLEWIFEIKWDGYRAIAEINKGKVKLSSRNKISFAEQFKPIVQALKSLKIDAVLDGEIVVNNKEGISKFQLIQNYHKTGVGNLFYYVFDIIYLNGYDLKNLPLSKRKEILQSVLPTNTIIKFSSHIESEGKDFFELIKKKGIEGIIAKNINSRYLPGKRSENWLKIKAIYQQEAIIIGFTDPEKSRNYFGSLLLSVYRNKKLIYIGKCGTGFSESDLKYLYDKLIVIKTRNSSLDNPPNLKNIHWVKPSLVCEIKFQEWTNAGLMRLPVFLGLRIDKIPKDVKEETPTPINNKKNSSLVKEESNVKKIVIIEGEKLALSNTSKIYWPKLKLTKADLINYYDSVSEYILPYLISRPQVLHRNPNGINDNGFYQKDIKKLPKWMQSVIIKSESNDKSINYALCNNKADLIFLANLGCIEFNPWLSRIETLDYPDFCVIDLDPLDVSFSAVIDTALAVKETLDNLKIKSYCKTSGKKGLHILIPLGAKYSFEESKKFAEILCSIVHKMIPTLSSLERLPSKRHKKVYLDFLQNRFAQTLAAPYSLRPVEEATISTPLYWNEIKDGLKPTDFTIENILERIKDKGDVLSELLDGESTDITNVLNEIELVF